MSPARTRRILVVDDSGPARLLVCQAIASWSRTRRRPVDVSEAGDGFEALRQLPRATFDLVLTDVNMPTLSGLELIRLIRARPEQRALPVVAVSTEREPGDADRARSAGADGYLAKPFDAEMLARILDELLPPGQDPS